MSGNTSMGKITQAMAKITCWRTNMADTVLSWCGSTSEAFRGNHSLALLQYNTFELKNFVGFDVLLEYKNSLFKNPVKRYVTFILMRNREYFIFKNTNSFMSLWQTISWIISYNILLIFFYQSIKSNLAIVIYLLIFRRQLRKSRVFPNWNSLLKKFPRLKKLKNKNVKTNV